MHAHNEPSPVLPLRLPRQTVISDDPSILTEIYEQKINMTVWKRKLTPSVQAAAHARCQANACPHLICRVAADDHDGLIKNYLGDDPTQAPLYDDIRLLLAMFCTLFGLKEAGMRIKTLDHAMCPRLHVDRVPCRLITTYCGPATEWLQPAPASCQPGGGAMQTKATRSQTSPQKQQLLSGDVALLKGEGWDQNEGGGLIHRSPKLQSNQKRWIMTLDF